MDWKSHLFLGILFSSFFAYFLNLSFQDYILFLIVGGISCLLPDIDHPKSKISQIFFALVFILILDFSFSYSKNPLQFLILSLILISIFFILYFTFKPSHRGLTHKLSFLLLFSLILYFFLGIFALAFFSGYLSHILADKLN
jgi:membrane-bound metal-dependent hydrolase YbcI (DUF457 family)